MNTERSDQIRGTLNQLSTRGYIMSDLLAQSLGICMGLYFLDQKDICAMQPDQMQQDQFENMVFDCLKKTDPPAAASFRAFFQVRLMEDSFQELLRFWLSYCAQESRLWSDKIRLREQIEDTIYTQFIQTCRSAALVPVWLVWFAIALLPVGGDTFYDGAAGAGGVAIRMAQHAQEQGSSLQLETCEEDSLLYNLSVLRARMYGFTFQQSNQDCLRFEDDCLLSCSHPKADRSIMFPPLRGGRSIHVSDEISCGGDWAYAYHQLCSLNEEGAGVCWVPNGALFNARNRVFREYLLKQNVIEAIVSLPRNLMPNLAASTSLVVFRRGRRKGDAIQMVDLSNYDEAQLTFESADLGLNLVTNVSEVLRENGRFMSPARLDPFSLSPPGYLLPLRHKGAAAPAAPAERYRHRDVIPLGDAVQVYRGINVAGLTRSEKGSKVLRLSDVQDGQIRKEGIAAYNLSKRANLNRYRIQEGDILISCKGKAVKLCLVSGSTPLLLSHDFLGLRADQSKVDLRYLFYYLQSPAGQQEIQKIQMGSSIIMIRAADLERLPFYYIPLAMQTQYASELYGANQVIEEQLAALQVSRQRAYEKFYQKIGLEDAL